MTRGYKNVNFPNISAIYDDSYHIFQAIKWTEL